MSEEFASNNPGWSRRPPNGQTSALWHMMRPPSKGSAKFIVIGHDLLGRDVHYWAGRTRPCIGADCQACNANQAPRWKGYVACIAEWNKQQVILEVTARMSGPIDSFFRAHRTLRGAFLTTERKSKKVNAATAIWLTESGHNMDAFVAAPDIRPILERMWEVHSVEKVERIGAKLRVLKTGTGDAAGEDVVQQTFMD